MDYVLQKEGPSGAGVANDLRELDRVCGQLIDQYAGKGARIIILSEYGITAVSKPVHLNRVLREAGLIATRDELGRELLDAGASKAFAVADHQVAHVYVNDRTKLEQVRSLLASTPGVARVLDAAGKREMHLDHDRAGEFVALAEPDAWFTYYYWLHDARMPDFARTVDIHRKPGYDPVELFLDPKLAAPKLKIATKLLRRKLGFRTMLDVIPTDATLVKGSHGLPPTTPGEGPLLMTNDSGVLPERNVSATDVFSIILRHLTG
jgi:predicted AlkP superfamily pyrophosphatase or phosphodiesterase